MGAGRVLAGVLFCIIAASAIVIFVTLGISVSELETLGYSVFQGAFLIMVHPYTMIIGGTWSVLAALGAGAFIGGLIAKGAKAGATVGIISFGLFLFLQIAVGVFFDFSALQLWWAIMDLIGSVIIDLVLAAGILVAVGAIGGALTGGE